MKQNINISLIGIIGITFVGINHFNNPKAFTEYSNDMHDVYKNIDEYNHDNQRTSTNCNKSFIRH